MATKIQRVSRIGGIAIGAAKAIFRTGKTWGTARTRAATARRPAPSVPSGAALVVVGVAGGAAGAYFLDPNNGQRRRRVAGRRVPAIRRLATLVRRPASNLAALVRRPASKEEAEAGVDSTAVRMAAANGAGGPVSETEAAAAAA
jgi:hypothetical protein